MSINFEFATATRIIFGPGKYLETGSIIKPIGDRALIISGAENRYVDKLADQFNQVGLTYEIFHVPTEPTISLIKEGIEISRQSGCEMVIGIGGGSVVDAGKAIAALTTNPGKPLDYLEVIGAGKTPKIPPLPYIAIPTTAGTGAEVTRNAVLSSPDHRVKVSLRSSMMLPTLAIIDPALTLSLPSAITASTGLDALTQCIEPYVSHLSNPLTDAICREGIHRVSSYLKQAYKNGDDLSARTNMSMASLFGGLGLANAKLGAVHGFAGPIGGMYPAVPHGVICGRLLPFVMEANVKALHAREPQNPALIRFNEIASIMTGNAGTPAVKSVDWIKDLVDSLNLPSLSEFGIRSNEFPEIIDKAQGASSMKGNPIKLTKEELRLILEKSMQ